MNDTSLQINRLHQMAMDLVDQALLARQRGDLTVSFQYVKSAFLKEQEAANLIAPNVELEPSRSVLHRSAAALAVECSEFREAERLIGRALAGNPPPDIADELRDLLLEEVYSQRQAIGDRI
jgi:hypothetical protein